MNKEFGNLDAVIKSAEQSGKKSYVFTATKEMVDRDGDIVFVSGIDTKNFETNPIILFNHDTNKPVGKAVRIWKDISDNGEELKMDIEFSSIPFAQEIKQLVDEGVLNTMSIRFVPQEYARNEQTGGYNIYKSELLESSVVAIPANAGALIEKYFGMRVKELVKRELNKIKCLGESDELVGWLCEECGEFIEFDTEKAICPACKHDNSYWAIDKTEDTPEESEELKAFLKDYADEQQIKRILKGE